MRTTTKLAAVVAIAGLAATGGPALTASSTVSAHKLGQSVGAITGYVTSDVAYTYNTDGTTITNVAFTLDAAATTVKARVTSSATATSYVSCTANTATGAAANSWNCDVTDVTVANANGLDVFASSI
jgi:hypothetical protein